MNPSNASWRGREPLGATQGAAGGDIYFAYLRFQADPPKENDLVDCLVEPHQGGRGQAPPLPRAAAACSGPWKGPVAATKVSFQGDLFIIYFNYFVLLFVHSLFKKKSCVRVLVANDSLDSKFKERGAPPPQPS